MARIFWVVLIVFLCGCVDETIISETFNEVVVPDNTLNYDKDLAVRLDLFQFGNEAGGIVRYHSLLEVGGTDESPFDKRERACFWTDRVRLKEDQTRFTLAFRDHHDREVRMTLDRDGEGVFLDGQRGFKRDSTAGLLPPSASILLEKQEDVPNRDCLLSPQEEDIFRYSFQFDERIAAEVEAEGAAGRAGALKVAIVWKGDDNLEVADWNVPLNTLGSFDQVIFHKDARAFPPGVLNPNPDLIPFVSDNDGGIRFTMGIPLVYRDRQIGQVDEQGEVPFDWQKSADNDEERKPLEPLVGSPFTTEDGNNFRGTVLFFVEGDTSRTPRNYKTLFGDRTLRRGYEVVEIVFDVQRGRVKSFTPVAANLQLFGRTPEAYNAFDDPGMELPRMPTACDRCDD